MAKVYLASSWRNTNQPFWVEFLRRNGHEVYDFRNPPHGRGGFAWSDIDPDWKQWTYEKYVAALDTDLAESGFKSDFDGMKWCDVVVLLLPCGRSAHLEAGWAAGAGKKTIVVTRDGEEPELMVKMCDAVLNKGEDVLELLKVWDSTAWSYFPDPPFFDHELQEEVQK